MNEFWEKVEHRNAKLIPAAVAILFVIIVIELFFKDFAHHYHTPILIIDSIVIAVFVVDLIFLGIHAKNTQFFFKHYWLDVLAIFPFGFFFGLVTKLYSSFLRAGQIAVGQAVVHETLEARKGARAVARSGKIARGIRVVARSIRVVTKSKLFTEFEKSHRKAKKNTKLKRNTRKKAKGTDSKKKSAKKSVKRKVAKKPVRKRKKSRKR